MAAPRLVSEVFERHYGRVAGGDWAEKLIAGSLTSYTPNQQLTNYHSIAHDHGGDLACPYLDERVISYCLQLPIHLRREKRILKEIAGRHLSPDLINRSKQVFMVPMADWMKGPLRPLVDLTFGPETVERRGLFDPAALAGLKKSFLDGSFTSWSDVWSFVLLEAWLRLNWDSAQTDRPRSLKAVFPEVRLTPEDGLREGGLVASGRGL
jgi:asparagine synthase (glutamine-hydrolysing)